MYAYCESLYDGTFYWTPFENFDKEIVSEKELSRPNFSAREDLSLANFCDQVIFFAGGALDEDDSASSEVFLYEVNYDKWSSAPAMNQARYYHSSCILDTLLYVYGGI